MLQKSSLLPKLAFEELQDAQLRLCSAELRDAQEAIDAEAISRKIDLSQDAPLGGACGRPVKCGQLMDFQPPRSPGPLEDLSSARKS